MKLGWRSDRSAKLKLLWVSCGDQDSLFNISEGVHKYLADQNVPHVWHIDGGSVGVRE